MENVKSVAVIYKSKYGSAERYARWIAEESGADLYESGKVRANDLQKYDVLIFGGSLYAVGILGIKALTDHFDDLKKKKLIVFSVGASPENPEARQHVLENNFSGEMQQHIDFFMLRGAFDLHRMNLGDRALMKLMKAKISAKKECERTEDERDLLRCFEMPSDWTSKDAIEPILACLGHRSPDVKP